MVAHRLAFQLHVLQLLLGLFGPESRRKTMLGAWRSGVLWRQSLARC